MVKFTIVWYSDIDVRAVLSYNLRSYLVSVPAMDSAADYVCSFNQAVDLAYDWFKNHYFEDVPYDVKITICKNGVSKDKYFWDKEVLMEALHDMKLSPDENDDGYITL